MNQIDFALDTKALDDEGHITGLAAGYGNLDFGGDVMLPGSLSKSLEGRSAVPMLLFHDHKRPAGVWKHFEETSEGLLMKGKISIGTTTGKEAHTLVKDGALGGLSVGIGEVKARLVGKARHIASAFLHEVSLVTIPMNPLTRVLDVKEIMVAGELPTVRQFEDFLRDAGGFSKTLAAAIASKAQPLLNRGEPDSADELAQYLLGLRA